MVFFFIRCDTDDDSDQILAGAAEQETSDDSDANGDDGDDGQDEAECNPRCQRGGFTAADIAKLKQERLKVRKDLDISLRKLGYVPEAEYEKKEKARRMERKDDDVDSRPSSHLHPMMKTEKERANDKENEKEKETYLRDFVVEDDNGLKGKDKEKEVAFGMDIETDDDTNGTRNKPSLSKGAPPPPATAPVNQRARISHVRLGGILRHPLSTPPSSESSDPRTPVATTPSDTPPRTDIATSTDIITAQVQYRSKDDSFAVRKFTKDEDKFKDTEKEQAKDKDKDTQGGMEIETDEESELDVD